MRPAPTPGAGRSGASRSVTYAQLGHLTNRFANFLRRLDIGNGGAVINTGRTNT
jgi:hypothetical protein